MSNMKNISLTVEPYSAYVPVPPVPYPQQVPPAGTPKVVCSVAFSAQFEDDNQAMRFASFIIDRINEFKGSV
jgi:hypothetical protein